MFSLHSNLLYPSSAACSHCTQTCSIPLLQHVLIALKPALSLFCSMFSLHSNLFYPSSAACSHCTQTCSIPLLQHVLIALKPVLSLFCSMFSLHSNLLYPSSAACSHCTLTWSISLLQHLLLGQCAGQLGPKLTLLSEEGLYLSLWPTLRCTAAVPGAWAGRNSVSAQPLLGCSRETLPHQRGDAWLECLQSCQQPQQ